MSAIQTEFWPQDLKPGMEWPDRFTILVPDVWRGPLPVEPPEGWDMEAHRDHDRNATAYQFAKPLSYGLPILDARKPGIPGEVWPEGEIKLFRHVRLEGFTMEAVSAEHAAERFTRLDDMQSIPEDWEQLTTVTL